MSTNVSTPALSPESAAQQEKVHKVEILISNLLRAGVITSMIIVLAGLLLMFVHHPEYAHATAPLEELTNSSAVFPHSVAEVIKGLEEFRGQAVVMLGLAILIATPVLRVAISIAAFQYQKDRTYVLITSVVLILLLASFFLGKVEG